MQLINAFVHNPIKVSVGVLLVALFGMVALVRMPMQLTPEVQTPTITIETRWPGASPQEIEQEIIHEQEEQLKSVEGVTKLSSESMDSMGRITMEFLVGTNMDEALLKVNSRLNQVPDYPEDADQPVITTANAADRPIAWFILSPLRPSDEKLAAFQQQHAQGKPDLAAGIEKVRTTENVGLAMLRLRKLAEVHPEVKELLPDESLDVTKLRRFAEDEIESRFERVPGVSQSNVIGGLEDELQVVVDPQKLAARRLTIGEVRTVLRSQNQDTSAGDYWEDKRRYVVRTLGQFHDPVQVENQLLAVRDGAPVYVRDVAVVRHGYKKPDGLVRRFGESSIAVNAARETGANVLDVMDGLRQTNNDLNETVLGPKGLQLTQVYDETEYIYSAIGLVQENIFIGGALTMIVLMAFLHLGMRAVLVSPLIIASALLAAYVSPWFFVIMLALIIGAGFWFARGALVVGLAIPTSIVGTFLTLSILGRSLNVVSLAGLAFAVGMLVDNSIVVLENIYRRFDDLREKPFTAAVKGTQEVWGAVVSSTLTTVAVFLPIVFVQEEAGQLFRDIALAITAAVSLSMVVSMIVIPPAAARLFRHREEEPAPGSDAVTRRMTPNENAPRAQDNGDHEPSWEGNGEGEHSPAAPRGRIGHTAFAASRGVIAAVEGLGSVFVSLVVGFNRWIQGGVIRSVAVVTTMVLGALILIYVLMPKAEYLPTGNRNLVFGIVLPPPGYNLDKLMEMGEHVETSLRPYWDIDPESPEAQNLDYPAIGDFFFVARGRQVFMGIRAHDPTRAGELVPLVQKVTAGLPGTFTVAKQSSLFEQGLTAGRTVEMEITGPDLNRLAALGGQILGQVKGNGTPEFPGVIPAAQVRPVPSLEVASNPELHVEPKLVQAAQMGVSSTDLGYAVNALVDGAYAGDYFLEGDKIDLTIMGERVAADREPGSGSLVTVEHAGSSQDVRALPIATPVGQLIPLEAVASIRMVGGPEQVNHRERVRAITIEVSPPAELPLEDAMQKLQAEIVQPLYASGQLDGGYRITLAGTADKLSTMRATFVGQWSGWNGQSLISIGTSQFVLVVLITYLLMAALFESWLYPFVIILSVPWGLVGGLIGLSLLNLLYFQALDVLTMLGFVILIGTVVNNPILIVHQALNHIREDEMTPRDAVLESVRTRIRPIFMTTTTTVLGLLPLVLFPGAGSELYRGLGAVVLGGLAVSTVFTLIFVPTLFTLTLETKVAILRLFHRTSREQQALEADHTPAGVA
jgi:HAE1 family hydrophobic/amphiphilic exporter-1